MARVVEFPRIIECEQGQPDWFAARLGMATASEFATVMSEGRDGILPSSIMDAMVKSGCSAAQLAAAVKSAKAKGSNPAAARAKYMRVLAAEIVRGEPDPDSYTNAHMERGKEQEEEARNLYAFTHQHNIERVGLIVNGTAGYSPDGLIGKDGACEFKSTLPHIQVDLLLKDKFPTEHVAQCQGGLWVADREWIDLVTYSPGLPLFVKRAFRDETYIDKLRAGVEKFNDELAQVVDRIRAYGREAAAA